MIRTSLLALVAPLALAATLFTPSKAEAANRFAVVGIENKTRHTITYKYKWGNNEWKTINLAPGKRWLHWWTYSRPNENRSPTFTVRFDSEFDPKQKPYYITYSLKRRAAPAHDWEDAKKYVFLEDGNKYFVDLKEVK